VGILFRCLAAVLLAAGLSAAGPAAAQTFPKFTGLVVDAADVIPPAQEAALTAKLELLQRETKRQLVMATIPDLQGYPLDDYGYRLGRAWGVGLRDVNNGAILFVAPNEPAGQRGPRIEVGTGLEGIVTDAFAARVIRERMMPLLRENDVPGALSAGADALVAQLRAAPEEAQARTDAAAVEFDRAHRRGGAGAGGGGGLPVGLIFFGIVAAVVLVPLLGARGRRGVSGTRYRSSGRRRGGLGEAVADNLPIILWAASEAARSRGGGWGGGGGGWSGGGDGSDPGGGWTDGGFSGGGGGSFGGGGASGEW